MTMEDLIKYLKKIKEKNLDVRCVHQIHDSIILEVKDSDVGQVKELIINGVDI